MAVVPSPFKVQPPDDLGTDRTLLERLWRVVGQTAAFCRAFVSGRVLEWHVDEIIDASGLTTISHNLRRKPFGMVIFRTDANAVPYTNYEAWTETTVTPKTAAGSMTISFVLFALVAAVGLPASATCVYGYTQRIPVRAWLCDTGADTATGAREGDTRYDKASDTFSTYTGSAWTAVGGATPEAPVWGEITGTLGDQTDLTAALTGKAAAAHAHVESDVTGLVSDLAGKAPTVHTHVGADVTSAVAVATALAADLPLSGLVQSASASRLLGRGSSGAGDYEPIVLGTNLSLSGTTLNASGGGGSGNAVEVSINLGTSGGLVFTTTVTGQSWVTTSSSITCTPLAVTTDGLTVETVYAAGVQATVSNKIAGTGFDLAVYSPHGATGTWRLSCLGV